MEQAKNLIEAILTKDSKKVTVKQLQKLKVF